MKISRELCMKCKGRLYCGLKYCPLIQRYQNVKTITKEDFEGSGFDIFIGRFNYPNVNIGVVSAPDTDTNETEIFNNHKNWLSNKMKINEITNLRSNTVYSYETANNQKIEKQEMNYVAVSRRPVYLDISLKNKLKVNLKSLKDLKPFGARAQLKKIAVEDNPKVPAIVEKILNDDMKSEEMVNKLDKHFDEDYIRKVFSSGMTGKTLGKKIVPTRWSITAIDDIRGKSKMNKIKSEEKYDRYEVYFSSLFGNYFIILTIPEVFSYELFEMYGGNPKENQREGIRKINDYTHDSETFFGRKNYASDTAGGYYASRLGVIEKLSKGHRQAGILVIRVITNEYTTPLGVWVVREAVRKTMNRKIKEFDNLKEAKDFIYNFIKRSFYIDISKVIKNSKIIGSKEKQRKIDDYFK